MQPRLPSDSVVSLLLVGSPRWTDQSQVETDVRDLATRLAAGARTGTVRIVTEGDTRVGVAGCAHRAAAAVGAPCTVFPAGWTLQALQATRPQAVVIYHHPTTLEATAGVAQQVHGWAARAGCGVHVVREYKHPSL